MGPTSTVVVSLDGPGWSIAADAKNTGRDSGWPNQPVAEAKPATVPGIIQEDLPACHGVVWYWKEFTAPAQSFENGRYLLRFWAVDYLAEVWVNGVAVGGHEGSETPFVLDATDAIKPGAANRLALRVLNPTGDPIDGIVLGETPHRNKGIKLTVGGMYNCGGIIESVELLVASPVRIENVFVRADWKTGKVRVQANVRNATAAPLKGELAFAAGPAFSGEVVGNADAAKEFAPGDTLVEASIDVPNHRLWELNDPYLYRLDARLKGAGFADGNLTRFGFRDFRVDKGYFRLNGKRVFVKSSHTGNHCPVGQIIPPNNAPDLLRKDLVYMKTCGFNMVRFIAGIAHPYQLDLCDELGLMVYEENLAAWCLGDSPKMAERFDSSLREMVMRDRNHPSLTIFGLLNETGDGPVFRRALGSLPLLRSLDDSRLVLLGSGRWDGQLNIGSVSNPGSAEWECVWGDESPDNKTISKWGAFGGYFTGAGDAHVYPGTPHTPEIESGIRNLGRDSKPVFLSEYGIGSLMNAIRELRQYEQHGINPELDDFKYFKNTHDKLTADWARLGFDGVYPFAEDMLLASQRMHCRQRTLGFDLIRSNPKICGYNLTGLLDHGFTGEGLWTFWREFKPGIVDTLQDAWAPLRWCMFASPMHAYAGKPVKLEVVLANEDVLAPGDYPVTLRVTGSNGIEWENKVKFTVPAPAPGDDGPLALPVFNGAITLSTPGEYTFAANMDSGGAPMGGRLAFRVSASPPALPIEKHVAVWGIDEKVQTWLKAHNVICEPLAAASATERQVILLGAEMDAATRADLLRRVAQGSTAVFVSPLGFKHGDNPVGWLPLKDKGALVDFSDWLYHKECVAKSHPLFAGLEANGIMDWDYYGPVISHQFFEGQATPNETAAAAFAVCHSSRPDGYAAGLMLGSYNLGEGKIILNTFRVLENIDQHPAADQLLMNMINYAAQSATGAPAALPGDFDAMLKALEM